MPPRRHVRKPAMSSHVDLLARRIKPNCNAHHRTWKPPVCRFWYLMRTHDKWTGTVLFQLHCTGAVYARQPIGTVRHSLPELYLPMFVWTTTVCARTVGTMSMPFFSLRKMRATIATKRVNFVRLMYQRTYFQQNYIGISANGVIIVDAVLSFNFCLRHIPRRKYIHAEASIFAEHVTFVFQNTYIGKRWHRADSRARTGF